MSGGIIENCDVGVATDHKGVSFTISGGTIRNNNEGIMLWGNSENCVVTISGGTIEKNGGWGLHLEGADSGFEKKKGAIIYGNSGDNKNGDDGAIEVYCSKKESNSLHLDVDAGKDEVYAAKINSGQTDIVEGSKQGPNW